MLVKILKCSLFNVFKAEVAHKADFIDKMDKLLNVFNSRSTSSKASMGHVLSDTSGHKEYLLAGYRPLKAKVLSLDAFIY